MDPDDDLNSPIGDSPEVDSQEDSDRVASDIEGEGESVDIDALGVKTGRSRNSGKPLTETGIEDERDTPEGGGIE